uniref:A20-type domain-containing protein n=1 Tax=Oryza nivara TaxID=4536 RepID=A0A0E0FSA3_ORYNI
MEQGSETLDERLPLPCVNGCGFSGSANTRGLCSKCYRDSLRQTVMSQAPSSSSSTELHGAVPCRRAFPWTRGRCLRRRRRGRRRRAGALRAGGEWG